MKSKPSVHVAAKDMLAEMNNICSPHVYKQVETEMKNVLQAHV